MAILKVRILDTFFFSNIGNIKISRDCSVPGAITKFNSTSVIIKENSGNPNVLDTTLTWGVPCSLNGELEFFNISIYGTRDGFQPHAFSKTQKCPNFRKNHMCLMTLSEEDKEDKFRLKGEFNYTFTISAKVKNIDTLGEGTSQSKLYPPGSTYYFININN